MFAFDFFAPPLAPSAPESKEEQQAKSREQETIEHATVAERVYPSVSAHDDSIQYRKISVEEQTYEIVTSNMIRSVEPGVYEGGAEIWECAIDLTAYLQRTQKANNLRVLELGCGRALPSLWALRHGATSLALCDFNAHVLCNITAPSVLREQTQSSIHFYSGAWGDSLSNLLTLDHGGSFDLILSAETTYRPELAQQLALTVARHLHKDGQAFIATKRYYFGLGGGAQAFVSALPPDYQTSIVWSCQDGASNIRDIIRVYIASS